MEHEKAKMEAATTSPNAICVCCTPNWLPYAAAVLYSCHEQGATKLADLYVVTIDAAEDEIKQFEGFADVKKFKARVLNVSLPQEVLKLNTGQYNQVIMARLFLHRWISAAYNKLLYLDCDVLALSPLDDLFATDMQQKPLAAVRDLISFTLNGKKRFDEKHLRQLGFDASTPYFNSGVLLFDWQRVTNSKSLENCLKTVSELPELGVKLKYSDQDVLNLEFKGNWLELDIKYNMQELFADYVSDRPVLRHFTWKHKPWGKIWTPQTARYNRYFRSILQNSVWELGPEARFGLGTIMGAAYFAYRRLNFKVRERLHAQLARVGYSDH